jgi:exosortase E/protease (VPEID-CTERM system)
MTPHPELTVRTAPVPAGALPAVPQACKLAQVRWLGSVVLLLAEVLLVTLLFRADGPFAGGAGLLLAYSPELLQAAIAAAAATAALAVWRIPDELVRAAKDTGPLRHSFPWFLLHLVTFATFLAVTASLFDPTVCGADPRWPPVLAWLGLGGAVAATAAATAVAPSRWPGLLRRGWGVLAAGLVIGVISWEVGQVSQMGWDTLGRPTLLLAYPLVRLACPEAYCDPDAVVLGTPAFQVQIAPFCSGLEGVGLILVYLTAYLYCQRRALLFPRALLLLPLGAVLAWLANVVRIALIVVVGDHTSPEAALGGVHSQAGWLAFNAVALAVVGWAHGSRLFAREPARPWRGENPTAAYLAPLLTLVAAGMLTNAVFNGSPLAYPLRMIAGAVVLCCCWPAYAELRRGAAGGGGLTWPLLVGAGVFVLWWLLEPLAPAGQEDPRAALAGLPPWAVAGWALARAVGSVVVVPLAEEIAFRGYLLRRLVAADFRAVPPGRFTWLAFLVSSVLFGLLHGRWLAGTLAGMAYAGAQYRRGRLADAVVAHATTNGLLTLVALTTGDWRAWS